MIRYRLLFACVLVLCCLTALQAAGPMDDVPFDHWAYDACDLLVKDGIIIGYPDGTFKGNRAMDPL